MNALKVAEIKAIRSYFSEFEAPNLTKLDRAKLFKKMFEFLYGSQRLLEIPGFRSSIKDKIAEVMKDEKDNKEVMKIIKEPIEKICSRLQWYEGEDAPTIKGCPGPLPEADYKILGAGTFGAVFEPALPNVIDGEERNFPGNVTKAFYKKSSLRSAAAAASSVARLMGENSGHRFNTYKKQYKGKNLPESLFKKLKEVKDDFKKKDDLHLMRLPNLGIDLHDVTKKNGYRALRNIPVRIVLEQIRKLLAQTASLAEHKYLHTDIRETNIMANPATGVFTIVDFDWLHPYKHIFENYPFGFYNNPPEFLLLQHWWDYILEEDDITEEFIGDLFYEKEEEGEEEEEEGEEAKKADKRIESYAKQQLKSFPETWKEKGLSNSDPEYIENEVVYFNVQNATYLKEKMKAYKSGDVEKDTKDLFFKECFPTFDNFGLAFSLLEMMAFVYPGSITHDMTAEKKKELVEYLLGILTKGGAPYTEEEMEANADALYETAELLHTMTSYTILGRPKPKDALNWMDRILKEYKRKVPAMNTNTLGELDRLALLATGSPPKSRGRTRSLPPLPKSPSRSRGSKGSNSTKSIKSSKGSKGSSKTSTRKTHGSN